MNTSQNKDSALLRVTLFLSILKRNADFDERSSRYGLQNLFFPQFKWETEGEGLSMCRPQVSGFPTKVTIGSELNLASLRKSVFEHFKNS